MPILPKDNHCCGCSACFNACPHDSIAMIRDFEGFYIPSVNQTTCTECKSCEIACPTLPFLNFAPYNAVAKKSQFPLMIISAITHGGGNRYLDSNESIESNDLSLRDSQRESKQSKPYISPSLAEGARGWVESLPFYFHKHSPKVSQTLSFSPKLTRFTEPKAFALKAKDDALRLNSSSGGAFSLIAQYVLNRGGVVFGASFDKNLNVVHRFIESPAELDTLRRSKYVESFIGDTFKQARDFLKAGRIVLFSGVQCQIHALNAFLRKPYSNLITLEVICNSVPSARIWDIYKQSLLESSDEKLIDFNFRGKDFGWESGIFAAKTKTKTKTKTFPHYESVFFNAFLNHTITRKSCGNCYSKGFVSGADFTIGDFWGIRTYHADFVDDKGVSCVLVHNQKALEILDSLHESAHIIATTAPIITLGNPAALHSNGIHANRDSILREVIETYSHTKDAKKAMAILSQYAQNPNPKPSALRHYYLVWKNDPLRKTISNALKKVRRQILNPKKERIKNEKS